MKKYFLIGIFLVPGWGFAQEVPLSTEQQVENLAEEHPEDDALLQQLAFYQKHPINLNTATADELSVLLMLSGLQIQSFLSYRSVFGRLLSIYELQAVPGFDLLTIKKLLPFVVAGEAQTTKERLVQRLTGGSRFALFRISRVLERAKGFDTSLRTHYLGDQNRLQARYLYQYKSLLYYGLVADKDAGEQFFKGAQKRGFDFYSLHFFARNLGRVKSLALGDYAVNLGQGLIQWHSLAFGKSVEVMAIKRQMPVLLPYRSAGEFYFNRGAAATLQLGPWQATAFVSYKKISGNLDVDSVNRFTALGASGYHRTRLEVEDRYRLSHFSSGGSLSFQQTFFRIGANAVMHRFSLPLQKRDEPYNRFAPAGRQLFLASLDYSFTHRNLHVFGELAADNAFHRAQVHGALLSMNTKVDFSLLYRAIAKEYQSLFGNAFTEGTLPTNENGFYAGISVRPATGWQLAAYADFYNFPFLKYRVSAPSRGHDYLAQVTYTPDKRTSIYLRYRTENKPLNKAGPVIQYPVDQIRQNLRFHFVTNLTDKLTVKARTEMTWFDRKGENSKEGFLSYIEAGYETSFQLRGNLRLQYFETGSYDSRIYAYESDVLYSFSIPAFFDKGFRYYVNLTYQASQQITCWLRMAQTVLKGKAVIGSGLDQIEGNRKTELKLQIRYIFH